MKPLDRSLFGEGGRAHHDTSATDGDPVDAAAYRDDGSGPARRPDGAAGPWYGAAIEPLASVSVRLKPRTCTMCGRGYESPVNGGGSRFCTDCRVIRDKQIHGTPTSTPAAGGTHGTQQESSGEV